MFGRKLLLIAIASAWLLPAAAIAGQVSDGPEEQQIQRAIPQGKLAHVEPPVAEDHDDHGGISSEVLAALIAGGLGLCGVAITCVVALGNRRRNN